MTGRRRRAARSTGKCHKSAADKGNGDAKIENIHLALLSIEFPIVTRAMTRSDWPLR